MATQLVSEFNEFRGKEARLSDVYVNANLGTEFDIVPLSDIRVFVNDSVAPRQLTSIRDFLNVLEEQRRLGVNLLFVYNPSHVNSLPNGIVDGSNIANDAGLLQREIKLPNTYVSNEMNGVKEDGSSDNVEFGLKRAVEINKSKTFNNDDPYVYVELANDANMKFIKKDDIGYYEGSRFVSFADLIRENKDVDILSIIQDQNRDLYTRDNMYVTKLFSSATCSVGVVKAKEEIDLNNLKLKTFDLSENDSIEETETDIDPIYSEQVSRRVGKDVFLDISNFSVDNTGNGDFIKVRFKGESVSTLVPISALYEKNLSGGLSGQINKETYFNNSKRYIGKTLFFKMPNQDTIYETEPLTTEQVTLTYKNISTMQVTEKTEDVLKDGTYLRLKDGTYVEENKSVRPNCYEYLNFNENNFDAYFVLTEPTSAMQGVIVDKNTFASNAELTIDGRIVKLANAVKIRLSSKPMKDCDIIQTTSMSNRLESCEILNPPILTDEGKISYTTDGNVEKTELSAEEKNQKIIDINKDFIEKYKENQYVVDKVVDENGNLVEIDQQKNRYVLSSIITQKDASNDLYEYKYLKSGTLKFDVKSNKFIGGPKYNTADAIGQEMAKGVTNLCKATGALFSIGGVFVLAVAPVVVAGAFAAIVATPVVTSIYHAIKGFAINHRKYNFKDRVEQNRKEFKNDIDDNLSELYEQTFENIRSSNYDLLKDYFKNEFQNSSDENLRKLKGRNLDNEINRRIKELSENEYKQLTITSREKYFGAFLDRMKTVEDKLYALAPTKYNTEFKVVDGVADVNETNAALFSRYRREMDDLYKDIRRLRRAVKSDPSKQAEYDRKVAEYQEKSTNYVYTGQESDRDKNYEAVENKVYLIKGLIAYKEFGDILDPDIEVGSDTIFSEEEKEFISHLDYNPKKNQFTYDGKTFSTKAKAEKVLSKLTGKNSVAENVMNVLTTKLRDYGKALPTYEYEDGKTLIRSKNAEIDSVLPIDNTKNTETEISNLSEHEKAPDSSSKDKETDKEISAKTSEKDKESDKKLDTETVTPKSRLTVKNLEDLLKRINQLYKYDQMYFGSDEDIVSDIDEKIDSLENSIRDDLHILKSAGRSKSDRYVKYKTQIVAAEKILKLHQIYNERRAKINVSATI